MSAVLDHVVIGGSDLGLLVAWWKHQTGIDPARGGRHDGFGTRNALIGVDDTTYVELISHDPDQAEPEQARPFGIDSLEPNSVQLCAFVLAVPDIAAATAAVKEVGLDPGPAKAMSRTRRDGVELTWTLAIPPDPTLKGALPALIQWGQGSAHPGSALARSVVVEEIVLGHPEPERLKAALQAIGSDVSVDQTPKPMIGCHFSVPRGTDFWL
jgi:hypothetical protein